MGNLVPDSSFVLCFSTFLKSLIISKIKHVLIFWMDLLVFLLDNIPIAADEVTQIEPPCPLEGRWKLEQECAARAVVSEWTDNMDDQRDVQTAKRNGSSRSLLSAGSAVAMEIKRKKIRQSTLFLQTEVWAKRYRMVRRQHWIIMTAQLTLVQSATILTLTS